MISKPSLPIQLLVVIALVFISGSLLPTTAVQLFYSISLLLKECLNFLLPFIIFAFISAGVISFQKNAPLILTLLVASVFASNFIVPLISYLICNTFLDNLTSNVVIGHNNINTTTPLLTIWLPTILNPEHAIGLALITSFAASYFNLHKVKYAVIWLKGSVEWIINHLFIPILPLYIFGFLLEVHHRGLFFELFTSYGKTIGLIIGLQLLCIFFFYLIASNFKMLQAITYMKNASASYLTAFGTMSSSAAIPVTTACAKRNTGNQALATMATPILANIHLLGDAITIPSLAIVTLFLFKGVVVSLNSFITFVCYFCLSMLAASGIPGGGMIIMIPILQTVLECSDEMISIMLTLHLLQDGFGTGANVMGDGALMIIINNILKKLKIY